MALRTRDIAEGVESPSALAEDQKSSLDQFVVMV